MNTENKPCPFCHISAEQILAENEYCFAFYDIFPVNKGHVLIVPKRHVASYFALSREEMKAMNALMIQMKQHLDNEFHPDGYNIGVNVGETAGQTVFHVHMHLIPRYAGDVENPKGGVRGVIPERQRY